MDNEQPRVDWDSLRAMARDAMRHAYVPYSNFPVGVAGLVDDGRTVVGCNVENASYGLTLCAECGMVSVLHATGGGRLVAVACVDRAGSPLMPCGRCRQLLWEHGGADCLVDHPDGPLPMAALLPYAFDDTDLATRTAGTPVASPIPADLRSYRGLGTAFVHPDVRGGSRIWTGYWTRDDAGAAPAPGGPPAILQEAPTWPTADDGVRWARERTRRVVVVDEDGGTWWAGPGDPPEAIGRRWQPAGDGDGDADPQDGGTGNGRKEKP